MTKRAHHLRKIVPTGPKADREAEKVLTRLLNEVECWLAAEFDCQQRT